jgi:hypothetical protein
MNGKTLVQECPTFSIVPYRDGRVCSPFPGTSYQATFTGSRRDDALEEQVSGPALRCRAALPRDRLVSSLQQLNQRPGSELGLPIEARLVLEELLTGKQRPFGFALCCA